ncbi:MAG: hypothetical protein E2O47_07210 [Gemmatimonadetes bacterium]|nr:MAG: hypothetical protein E2O47_07210 [Gemmatimonadota bacterium]
MTDTVCRVLLMACLLSCLTSSPVAAQDRSHGRAVHHRNHLGLFAGAATEFADHTSTTFAAGADYERRLSQRIGVGVMVDLTFGELKRNGLAVAGIFLHPARGWRLFGGAGVEFVDTAAAGTSGGSSSKSHVALRLATAYDFPVGRFLVGPIVAVDLLGETETILSYGLTIGLGF